MATSEFMRSSSSDSAQRYARQDEWTSQSTDTPLFPTVPSHDPRSITEHRQGIVGEQEDKELPPLSPPQDRSAEVMRPQDDAVRGAYIEEEEIEEVLEELQDDEMEETTDVRSFSSDSATHLLGQEGIETLSLVESTQLVCISTIQSLLRSISINPAQTATLGGKEILDLITKASDTAAISNAPSTTETRAYIRLEGPQSIENLVAILEHIPTQGAEGVATNDDVGLLASLRDLVASLNVAKQSADLLDSRYLQVESNDMISPTTSQASSISPKELPSPTSMSLQQAKVLRLHRLGRHYVSSGSSPLISSSPSTSREELRNPFSDVVTRSPVSSEERLREKGDRDVDNATHFVRILRNLDKRCNEVLGSLEIPTLTAPPKASPASLSPANPAGKEDGSKEKLISSWTQVRNLSKNTQKLVASRRTSLLALNLETRRGSISPISYSPTYSPSRGRSRRNSSTSRNSPAATLNQLEGGDPQGEAMAAGVGVGAPRSLSRISHASSPSSTTNAMGLLSSPGPSGGIVVTRRGSTKSDMTTSGSVHSAPPRYSEDASRNWSESGLNNNTESDSSAVKRRDRQSSGDMSDYSIKTLPAYNSMDSAYQSARERKGSSTSSLAKYDNKMLPFREREDKDEQRRSLSDRTRVTGMPSSSSRQANLTNQTGTASTEYIARTSQDLRMVESSIERLYSAVPQLHDQRASNPTEIRERQSQNVLLLIEKLAKSGRMEDQRAVPPTEAVNRIPSVAASPETTANMMASQTTPSPTNNRLARRLGSINFGNLSLRIASGKGKEKERVNNSTSEVGEDLSQEASLDDLFPLADQVQAASQRGFDDQRAQIQPRPAMKSRPSKLDLMGVSVSSSSRDRIPT